MRQNPPRAVDVAAVRDEDQLPAVRRPGGREVVIPAAVVGARSPLVPVLGEALRRTQAGRGHGATKTCQRPSKARRHERDAAAVGRPARLEVHGAVPRERLTPPEARSSRWSSIVSFDPAREHDGATVGRPVGLEIVAGAVGELDRVGVSQPPDATAFPASNRRAPVRPATSSPPMVRSSPAGRTSRASNRCAAAGPDAARCRAARRGA